MRFRSSPPGRGGAWWAMVVIAVSCCPPATGAPPLEAFIRGDANASGNIDIADGIAILNFLFRDRFVLTCMDAADFDDSGTVNITDGILLLHYLFGSGREPPAPFPSCDIDPTDDGLRCDTFAPCFVPFSEIDAVRQGFDLLTTIAGRGDNPQAVNAWMETYEDGPATDAELSRPHIALGDRSGNVYVADKEAHAIRRIAPNGTITTYAGIGEPGDDDAPGPAKERRLREPNGLWLAADGTVYVLDTGNEQIKKITTGGLMSTLLEIPGLRTGRGLWVADDETLIYVASRTEVLKWTPAGGLVTLASGFSQLGNLAVDAVSGHLVVTDRDAHRVYRVERHNGSKTVIAGNGTTSGGGDGRDALETGLDQVRGVWPLEELGGYFLATQRGSQLWYLDTSGKIHLFLDGSPDGVHEGDGRSYSEPGKKCSNIRSVTRDRIGNLLITEHDAGYVRRIEFIGIALP